MSKNYNRSSSSSQSETKRVIKTRTKDVESGTEFVTKRTQTVWNTESGSIVSDGTTGNKKIQITSEGGGNINLNDKVNSEFAPNDKQTLVHGKKFETVAGDNYETTKGGREIRVEEDLTFITGSEKFFNEPVAEEWIEKNQDLAAAKAAPEYNYGAVGNNTETEYADGGTRDSESGAVEGGSYTPSDAHADIPALMESKAADIAATEAKMGVGGSIKMMTTKHMFINAGTKAVTFDSGVMVPRSKKVVKSYEVDGGECKPVYTSVSTYESKDTSGSVPFGGVTVSAASKFNVVTGSGGVSIKSAGEVNVNSTGRLMLGGAEAAITGSNKSNTGRITMISDTDMFQEAGVIATRVAPNINDIASTQHSFHTPKGVFTGDLHIKGNVTVEGPDGIRVPAGDVIAGSVSLKNHTHGGVCAGSDSTSGPNGSGSSSSSSSSSGGSSFSGNYNDLSNTPTLFSGSYNDLTDTPADNSFSGSYNDLTDIPTTITGSYNDLTDQPTILDSVAVLAAVAAVGYTSNDGDITNVSTGPYLTGGGASGAVEVGINSACSTKWDSAAGGGIATLTAGTGLSGGGSGGGGGASVDIGVDAALVTYLDQSSCPGLNCVGTLVAGDITGLTDCIGTVVASDISSFTDCIGTVVASDISSFTDCIGTVVASDISSFTDCVGTVSCVTTTGDYLTGGGSTTFNIGIDSACGTKWDAATDCLGTVTGTGTNNTIAAFSTAGAITDSKLRQTFTEVIVGATLSATGGLKTEGQILSAGQELHALFGGGGALTNLTATDGIASSGGTTPTICLDSTVVRTTGNQVIGGTKHFTSAAIFPAISATGAVTADSIQTGAVLERNASSPDLYCIGTVLALNVGGCVVESTQADSSMVFGVAAGYSKAPVVMGAEPVCMTGDIKVGDFITTSNCNGHGKKSTNPYPFGTIIGQAMEDGSGDSYAIKAMIRKM